MTIDEIHRAWWGDGDIPAQSSTNDSSPVNEVERQETIDLMTKVTKNPEFISKANSEIVTNLSSFCRIACRKGMSLEEYMRGMDGDNTGNLHSSLSNVVTPMISEMCTNIEPTFEYVGKKKIDYMWGYRCGDWKTGFGKEPEYADWTGNIFPKEGFMILFKFQLDYLCPIKDTQIIGMFCGVIHEKYVRVNPSKSKGRTSIVIPNESLKQLYVVVGYASPSTSLVHVRVDQINNIPIPSHLQW